MFLFVIGRVTHEKAYKHSALFEKSITIIIHSYGKWAVEITLLITAMRVTKNWEQILFRKVFIGNIYLRSSCGPSVLYFQSVYHHHDQWIHSKCLFGKPCYRLDVAIIFRYLDILHSNMITCKKNRILKYLKTQSLSSI